MRRRVKHHSPYLKYYKKRTFLYLPPVFTVGDCRSWKRRPTIEHTWVQFKAHSTLAYTSLRETQLTTGGSLFHDANIIVHQEYSDVINTLVTNATEQHTLVANVVQPNTTLLDQIKTL